jgi:hypothetical protein
MSYGVVKEHDFNYAFVTSPLTDHNVSLDSFDPKFYRDDNRRAFKVEELAVYVGRLIDKVKMLEDRISELESSKHTGRSECGQQ